MCITLLITLNLISHLVKEAEEKAKKNVKEALELILKEVKKHHRLYYFLKDESSRRSYDFYKEEFYTTYCYTKIQNSSCVYH